MPNEILKQTVTEPRDNTITRFATNNYTPPELLKNENQFYKNLRNSAEKSRLDELLKNEEINTLIHTIGAGLGNDFDICIYTGALIDEVKKLNLSGFKFIKCGVFDKTKFIGSKKTDEYIQFATSNQELYNEFLELISHDGIYYF